LFGLKKMNWQQIPLACELVDPQSDITFVDSTKSAFDSNQDKAVASFNPERLHSDTQVPMSPCYQCVLFFSPRLKNKNDIHAAYSKLELWVRDGKLFFFRAPQ